MVMIYSTVHPLYKKQDNYLFIISTEPEQLCFKTQKLKIQTAKSNWIIDISTCNILWDYKLCFLFLACESPSKDRLLVLGRANLYHSWSETSGNARAQCTPISLNTK